YWVQLEKLPVNANGKIDKAALLRAAGMGMESGMEYIAPRNEVEKGLAVLWGGILRIERPISIRDNFFDLGGHSLKITRLASHLHRLFHVKISLKELFAYPVLEEQARLILQAQDEGYSHIRPAASRPYYPLSSMQRRLWWLNHFEAAGAAYNISAAYWLEGSLNKSVFSAAFLELIRRHESLRTIFREDGSGTVNQFIQPVDEAGFVLDDRDMSATSGELDSEVNKLLQT